MTHCLIPRMKNFLVVAPGALRKIRQIKDFGGKAHCHFFSDGKVKALRAILVPGALRLDMAEALDPSLHLDQLESPGSRSRQDQES